MVVEFGTEYVIDNAITGKQAYTWSEVIRADGSLYHDRNVRTVDDTGVVELRTFIA
jgi:hypothetical protein